MRVSTRCALIAATLCLSPSLCCAKPVESKPSPRQEAKAAIPADPVLSFQEQDSGVICQLRSGTLELRVCSPRIIRVLYRPTGAAVPPKSLSVNANFRPVPWGLTSDASAILVKTAAVQARIDRQTGAVQFLDKQGAPILSEVPARRQLTPVTLPGPKPQNSHSAQQHFVLNKDEAIYGLGQHQDGFLDYSGSTVVLEQANREIAIPFLVSSRGYGVLWDNPAYTKVSVGARTAETIPATNLETKEGKSGGLTGSYFHGDTFTGTTTTRIDPKIDFDWTTSPPENLPHDHYSVRWTGFVRANTAGDYILSTRTDDGVRLWIDDKLVIDDWNARATKNNFATVHFDANSRHSIRMEYYQDAFDATVRLSWQQPGTTGILSWESEAAPGIDYYFVYGPALDTVMQEYRQATGNAPLPPKWALGYWQSKEHYGTQQEWLDIAEGYRSRRYPIDNLVQDWYYWNPAPWGSHQFDPKRYPDPAAAIATLHDKYNIHIMISVWGRFAPGTPGNPDKNYDVLKARHFLYPEIGDDMRYYDAFNPDARALYWKQMQEQIFRTDVDAWWLDASEPEVDMKVFRQVPTALGLGAQVLNAYPLLHTTGVYQGQRAAKPDQRVFILTRSAYAGMQRNAAAAWSGDITASWDVFAKQIPAGLNIALSGIPYWTTDIGGFFVNYPGGANNPEYRELYTRWFQFGAFCPIFRSHGTNTPREMWQFGPEVEQVLLKYDNLRYRLMPYIYSQAWQVTSQGGTIMRPLVMDFPQDKTARQSRDQFLFGPAILVCPVTKPGADSRAVYLPSGTTWTDFWTAKKYTGGQTITAKAPLDTMPLYVRAGAIVPMGPFLQHVAEKPADPIELRVYRGANGSTTLYEDEGNTYAYERGERVSIPIRWDEKSQTLTIGKRTGTFPGMQKQRTFHIVWVRPGQGAGVEPTRADQTATYTGTEISIKAR